MSQQNEQTEQKSLHTFSSYIKYCSFKVDSYPDLLFQKYKGKLTAITGTVVFVGEKSIRLTVPEFTPTTSEHRKENPDLLVFRNEIDIAPYHLEKNKTATLRVKVKGYCLKIFIFLSSS